MVRWEKSSKWNIRGEEDDIPPVKMVGFPRFKGTNSRQRDCGVFVTPNYSILTTKCSKKLLPICRVSLTPV